MDRLGKLFDLASLTSGGSASGHESQSAEAQSGLRLIGTVEAAHLLGQSSRQVRRLAADLDGQKIGRDWYFNYDTVIEYAKARQK